MKAKLLIGIVVVTMMFPPVSHGAALLRYVFDAVCNQLGLDRGPIAKVPPRGIGEKCPPGLAPGKQPGSHRIYIQAEGF